MLNKILHWYITVGFLFVVESIHNDIVYDKIACVVNCVCVTQGVLGNFFENYFFFIWNKKYFSCIFFRLKIRRKKKPKRIIFFSNALSPPLPPFPRRCQRPKTVRVRRTRPSPVLLTFWKS